MAAADERPVSVPERALRGEAALEKALRTAASVDLSWIGRRLGDDGWELAPDMLRLLAALLRSLRPRHVLEFGSGVSTLVLAHAAGEVGGCEITSFEHDPRFAAATRDSLDRHALGDAVDIQLAPLVAGVRGGDLCPQYLVEPATLEAKPPADIVLIDGPPEVLGGRSGMLYQALDFAQCGSVILLDDAGRESEQIALDHWRERLGDAVSLHRPDGFAKGLAVAVVVAPTTAQIRIEGRPRSVTC